MSVITTITYTGATFSTDKVYTVTLISTGFSITTGSGGGSFYYRHVQSIAASVWTINHNLGASPNVKAFTTGGVEVMAEVLQVSLNQTQITFDLPFTGFAICS